MIDITVTTAISTPATTPLIMITVLSSDPGLMLSGGEVIGDEATGLFIAPGHSGPSESAITIGHVVLM